MRIVILGASGFLGQKLVKALLQRETLTIAGEKRKIEKIVVFDQIKAASAQDLRLEFVTGDITHQPTLEKLFSPDTDIIIHLAAIVSGQAEKDFDLGMKVNLLATLHLLELCRNLTKPPKFLFASSIAVFGGDIPEVIQDSTYCTPQSSYGTQKAVIELLVSDYSRKGFMDGLTLRFPTLVVRPGKPNAATSTFASSIIREPLQGQRAVCPVTLDTKLWILSPRQAVHSILKALELDSSKLASNRTLSLPGITVSVKDMIDALEVVAGTQTVQRVDYNVDPFIQRIVGSWPSQFNPKRALELGFESDHSMVEIIQNFIDDDIVN